MALYNRAGSKPITFLSFNGREGKFIHRQKVEGGEPVITAYDGVSGYLVAIAEKPDMYEGKPSPKLVVMLQDADGAKYQIETNASVRAANELVARLNNADLTQPVQINGYHFAAGTEMTKADGTVGVRAQDSSGFVVYQGPELNTKILPNYGATGEKRPEPPKLFKKGADGQMTEVIDKDEAKVQNLNITRELGTLIGNKLAALSQQGQHQGDDGIGADEAAAAVAGAQRQRAA